MSLGLFTLNGWFNTHCHETTPVGIDHQPLAGGGVVGVVGLGLHVTEMFVADWGVTLRLPPEQLTEAV
jgi:hypothetical protein